MIAFHHIIKSRISSAYKRITHTEAYMPAYSAWNVISKTPFNGLMISPFCPIDHAA